MNKVYKRLLNQKIENFLSEFFSSKELFEDLDKRNRLRHAGEYGMYRENICNELIKFAIPSKFNTANGFLINSFDEVSTQCDLVIYDHNNTPLIQDSSNIKFFPVETVVAVGEVKSKLTISDLCLASLKLAKIKKMKRLKSIFPITNPDRKVFEPHMHFGDTIYSFIICESISSFNANKVFEKLDKTYNTNNIEYEYRHNAILSIENGVLCYKNENAQIPKGMTYFSKMKNIDIPNHYFEGENINKNIENLITGIAGFLSNANVYRPEPNNYT